MNDPYKVLGVPRDATDEQIKKAYRELARKYHPDQYTGNPLSDLVAEKMKEINEAYDTIQKNKSSGGGGANSYGGSFSNVRALINAERYTEAELILDSASASDRNAEWNYLKGCVLLHRGWYFDAQKYIETACYLDPDNEEYKNARINLRQSSEQFGKGYRTQRSSPCSVCNICTGLLCADCLCECCGGDLIKCC